jgi:hypothetical protein
VSAADPFAALGLPARPDLGDDEVRAAWRRIASAVHPDRADGGDPARFAEAAAAYTVLRTVTGRREAYADLTAQRHGPGGTRRGPARARHGRRVSRIAWRHPGRVQYGRGVSRVAWRGSGRVRRGRPAVLALRLAAAAGVSAGALAVAGPEPASFALIAGAVTWLARTGYRELAPPARTGHPHPPEPPRPSGHPG